MIRTFRIFGRFYKGHEIRFYINHRQTQHGRNCSRWTRACLKNHSRNLHAPLCGIFCPNSDVGVAWQDGRMFLHPCAIRMNLALPLGRVQEAFDRLDKYVFNADK